MYKRLARVFKALSHPVRLRILRLLAEDGAYVCQLVEATDRPQPYISQHLMVLRDAGLVTDTRDGAYVQYRLSDPRLAGLLDFAIAVTGGESAIEDPLNIWLDDVCPACGERRRRNLCVGFTTTGNVVDSGTRREALEEHRTVV